MVVALVRRAAMDLVRERYADFGPTFAREKLVEVHGYRLSVETLRKWMVAEGVWRAKARRAARVHQSRPRRECAGDLVQIDGSPHDWFRGLRAGLHADCVHRRRDLAPAGAGALRGGDDRGVHGDDAGASDGARATGGVLLGPVRGIPGQQEGQGGRVDAVLAGFADARHRGDPHGRTRRYRTGW